MDETEDLLQAQIRIFANEKIIYVNVPTDVSGDIVVMNILGEQVARINSVLEINLRAK